MNFVEDDNWHQLKCCVWFDRCLNRLIIALLVIYDASAGLDAPLIIVEKRIWAEINGNSSLKRVLIQLRLFWLIHIGVFQMNSNSRAGDPSASSKRRQRLTCPVLAISDIWTLLSEFINMGYDTTFGYVT